MGSQVIVNGEVLGNREAKEYFRMKKSLIPSIMKAYGELDKSFDVIVIEGAGSPAEINLKDNDIVNMGLARMVDAPVLLVGDIDRGGVFAQLLGTIWLLEEEERARVKGLVINKFRGDKTILDPGLKQLYDKCRIPITGVIPYTKLDIDDEDSLSERLDRRQSGTGIDAAVIRFPHISNFTDFGMLEGCEGVSVRYVNTAGGAGKTGYFVPARQQKYHVGSAVDKTERPGSGHTESHPGGLPHFRHLRRLPDAGTASLGSGRL